MIFIEIYLQIRNIDDFSNKKQAKKANPNCLLPSKEKEFSLTPLYINNPN